MNKKYQKPITRVTCAMQTEFICSSVTSTDGNSDLHYGGGSSGPARARQNNLWTDSDEEYEDE